MKKYLGPKEIEVVARLSYEKITVITRKRFDNIFNFDTPLMNQIIFRLKRKGILKPIKKGIYFYSPLESGPAGSNINEFIIPSILYPQGNYYIGYATMYNYYGFIEQIFQVMYVLNTTKQYDKIIGNIRFKMIKISPKRMYGIEKIKINNVDVSVSDKERTLVDLIYFSNPVGGLQKAFEILRDQVEKKKIDIRRFIEYASQFPVVSARKRIGFILDECGLNDIKLTPLLKSIKKTSLSTLYNLKSRRGKINNKWKIIENVTSR